MLKACGTALADLDHFPIDFQFGRVVQPGPTGLLFPKWPSDLFNAILDEEKLRTDRDDRPRTAYSLRHTYICLRLLQGADIYRIAKNCRTSVEMIEKHYATHLKTARFPPPSTS
jgi:integrase